MTLVTVEKHLSKEAGQRAALKKIEAEMGDTFNFSHAYYICSTGQAIFIEAKT